MLVFNVSTIYWRMDAHVQNIMFTIYCESSWRLEHVLPTRAYLRPYTEHCSPTLSPRYILPIVWLGTVYFGYLEVDSRTAVYGTR